MNTKNSSSPITSSPEKIHQRFRLTVWGWLTICVWIGSWIAYALLGPYCLIAVFLTSLLIIIGGWEYDSSQKLSIKLQFTHSAPENLENNISSSLKNSSPMEAKIVLYSLGAFPLAPSKITLNGYFPSEEHPLIHTLKTAVISKRQPSSLYLPLHFSTSGTLCIQSLIVISTGFLRLFTLSITYSENLSLVVSKDTLASLNSESATPIVASANKQLHHEVIPNNLVNNSSHVQPSTNDHLNPSSSPFSPSHQHDVINGILPSDSPSIERLMQIISCAPHDYLRRLSPFTFLERSSRLASDPSASPINNSPIYIPSQGSLPAQALSYESLPQEISMNELLSSHTVVIPFTSSDRSISSHIAPSTRPHNSAYVPLFSLSSDNETSSLQKPLSACSLGGKKYDLCIFIDRQNTDYQAETYYKEAQNITRYISIYSVIHRYSHILSDGNFYEPICASSDYLPHLHSQLDSLSTLPLFLTAPLGQPFARPLQLIEQCTRFPYSYTVIITGQYCPLSALESYAEMTKNPLPLTYIQVGSQAPHVSNFSQFSVIHVQSWKDLQIPLPSHILRA